MHSSGKEKAGVIAGVWLRSGESGALLNQRRSRSLLVFALLSAATAVYGYHLGVQALGPSEAYSALAAAQPTVAEAAHDALQYDPGKTVLYHVMLHGFCELFGLSEAALRCFSLLFGVATLGLLFSYGNELFGFEVGFAATALWAFCPVAVIDARWARMYSLFVALALAHLLTMARLRRKANAAGQFLAGVLGTAMLCSHLGAVLLIIGDTLVLVREFRSTGRSVTWPALVIAIVLFLPFFRLDVVQTHALLFGHWLDWIGASQSTASNKVLIVVTATAILLWLSLARPHADDRSEAFRRCLIYAVVPPLALVAGSILLRPMFNIRYVAPSLAVGILILAFSLNLLGARVRNEATFALAAFLLILVPLTYAALVQPWRNIAAVVAAGDQRQTIFFESGFFSHERLISQDQTTGFPSGFFRVPFDYYFKLSNNRGVLPGSNPEQSRLLMELAVNTVGGAWLISGKNEADARSELPAGPRFEVDFAKNFSRVLLFHVSLARRAHSASPGLVAVRGGQ